MRAQMREDPPGQEDDPGKDGRGGGRLPSDFRVHLRALQVALDQATSGRHMHGVWQDRFPHAHDERHGPDPGSRWHHLESPAH